MSRPIKYWTARNGGITAKKADAINDKSDNSALVAYSDYAALVAENERLRKAGDAMRDCVDSDTFPNIIAAWNAAKEGRDAK